jgi:predicted HNH restriction endonuclease
MLAGITILADQISHEELATMFPSWGWAQYPRMYTTPPEAVADKLWDLALDHTPDPPLDVDTYTTSEGQVLLRRHLIRERDPKIVEAKKCVVLKEKGGLKCEICSFNFEAHYGELGRGFCEVHHLQPIGNREVNEVTHLSDLAVVCSNCHRMLHRGGLISMSALKKICRTSGK